MWAKEWNAFYCYRRATLLSTLIYCSHVNDGLSPEALDVMLTEGRERNAARGITGILLFDGIHFVQLLEGPAPRLDALLESIRRDPRHRNVVVLLQDNGPCRRFDGDPCAMVDLRVLSPEQVSSMIHDRLEERASQACSDDRVFKVLMWYALARGTDHIVEGEDALCWRLVADVPAVIHEVTAESGQNYKFALQPIVDPIRRVVTSFEFLMRSQAGGSPEPLLAAIPPGRRHLLDLESKTQAFHLARRLGLNNIHLSVNLLPMSLTDIPGSVERLVDQIVACGLSPSQVMVEVTEQEAISSLKAFSGAIKRLRRAGIGIAIDDFGAGFAGLSLLAEFQPDKLKIDRSLIRDIHRSGPRQAIVRAIVQVSVAMGITPVAEGVERLEEWCWLQAAGVQRFQGYLFARPAVGQVPAMRWPERILSHGVLPEGAL